MLTYRGRPLFTPPPEREQGPTCGENLLRIVVLALFAWFMVIVLVRYTFGW